MQQPELYSKFCGLQKTDATYVLENYFRLIKWNIGDVIMDVGCGSADVTLELLLPRLPNNFSKLIGVDIADVMVQSAKRKTKEKRVIFRTFDVTAEVLPLDFKAKINHLFSFYCLHWIQEQRRAIQNIYDMIKPGGDALFAFLASNPIYDICANLSKHQRWALYMTGWEKYCSPYQHCENPEAKLEKLLSSVGFISHVCKVETKTYTYPNMESLKKSVLAVVPFISKMQPNEVDIFMEDYIAELRKTKNISTEPCENNNEEAVTFTYKLFIVFASKLI